MLIITINKQANNLCSEDLVTAGNMYFRTSYHYNKEAVRDKYVQIYYINTQYNCADATTKALGSNKVKLFAPWHTKGPVGLNVPFSKSNINQKIRK